MYLMGFRYTIDHISGDENSWADLLSRWAMPTKTTLKRITIPLHPLTTPNDFPWPTLDAIQQSQVQYCPAEDRKDLKQMDGLLYLNTDLNGLWTTDVLVNCGHGFISLKIKT